MASDTTATPLPSGKSEADRPAETSEKVAEKPADSGAETTAVQPPAAPDDFEVKHPLQDSWTWWFDNPKKKSTQSSWFANLKKIYSFGTVEDFWSLWNNIKGAHELAPGSDYHVFKEGVQPMWEDKRNRSGGKWVLLLKNQFRKTQLNQYWLSALLACIGASFDDDTQITGVVVSLRKSMDKLALWTSDSSDSAAVKRIGEQLKALLQLPATTKITYQAHADALDSNSSYNNKSRFEL